MLDRLAGEERLLCLNPGEEEEKEGQLDYQTLSNLQSVSQSDSYYLLVGQNLSVLLVLPNLLDDVEGPQDLPVRQLSQDGIPVCVLHGVVVELVLNRRAGPDNMIS